MMRTVCTEIRSLLQSHQNALVIGQRCAGLSPRSADRIYQFTRDPRRTYGFSFSVHTGNTANQPMIAFPINIPTINVRRGGS
jgi:hypothetical protein